MRRFPTAALASLSAFAGGCSATTADQGAIDGTPSAVPQGPRAGTTMPSGNSILGVVETRDERLIIHSGPGLRFTVQDRSGSILSANLDSDALAERHEALYRLYRSGYAKGGPYLDARLDPPAGD